MEKLKIEFLDIYIKDKEFIHKLLSYNFRIPLNVLDNKKNTLLHLMILKKDVIGSKLLLKYIQQFKNLLDFVNFQNSDGNTPMHLTVLKNISEISDILVNLGAKLDIANNNNEVIELQDNNNNNNNNNDDAINLEDIIINKLNYEDENDINIFKQQIYDNNNNNNNNNVFQQTKYNDDDMNLIKQNQYNNNNNKKNNNNDDMNFIKQTNNNFPQNQYNNDSITSGFYQYLMTQNGGAQNGGAQNNIKGSRIINNELVDSVTSDTLGLNDILNNQTGGKKKTSRLFSSERINKPSNDLHKEVLDIIIKHGFSEEDARYIKAGLYTEVKNKFSNLSNLQRALKLKELATESNIKDLGSTKKLTKLKHDVDKAREERKTSSNNPSTHKPPHKPSPSVEKKTKKVSRSKSK